MLTCKKILAGEHDDINNREFLTLALTTHIREVSQDKHLWGWWHEESLPEDYDT
ncbi:MAG: hypothetical protein PVF83_09685 [Anaerolineales bacterium]